MEGNSWRRAESREFWDVYWLLWRKEFLSPLPPSPPLVNDWFWSVTPAIVAYSLQAAFKIGTLPLEGTTSGYPTDHEVVLAQEFIYKPFNNTIPGHQQIRNTFCSTGINVCILVCEIVTSLKLIALPLVYPRLSTLSFCSILYRNSFFFFTLISPIYPYI